MQLLHTRGRARASHPRRRAAASLLAVLGLATCLLPPSDGQETAEAVPQGAVPQEAVPQEAGVSAEAPGAEQAAAMPSDAELLGAPLVIDGETISSDAIKRQIIWSTNGRTLFELAKLRIFIQREMERQISDEGKTLEDFDVDESEVREAIDQAREQVAAQYQGQDVVLEDIFPEINSPAWLDNLRLTKLFRRVFLPKNPHQYPPLSVTAITAGQNGEELYKALVDQWDAQQAEAEAEVEGEAEVDEQPGQEAGQQFMDMLLQQTVVTYLTENSEIELPEDGIPDHLLGIVDGKEITVASIWDRIKSEVGPMDVWRAKKWFVNVAAAEKALKQAGAWIPWDEAMALYQTYAEPYEASFLSIPKIATVIKKFPTLGNYKTYYQIQESFRKLSSERMTDEALTEQGDRKTSYLVSQAKVDVDIILLSAYDFQSKSWKQDGWAEAERKAVEVAQKLAEGEDWNELLETYSEFYDQPIPTDAQNNPDLKLKNKGRFRGVSRNDLLRLLEESDFSIFLAGNSITDEVFFDQAVGTIENPIRGPHGWYIPRLIRKTPPTTRLSATDADQREYLVQDWIADNLNDFVKEHVAKLEVSGVDI